MKLQLIRQGEVVRTTDLGLVPNATAYTLCNEFIYATHHPETETIHCHSLLTFNLLRKLLKEVD